MQFVEEFIKALSKRQSNRKISYVIDTADFNVGNSIEKLNVSIPKSVESLYSNINGLKINEPRTFELLRFEEIKIIDDKYLFFAVVNDTVKICFVISHLNTAGEWDIVEFENKYVITKTLASFLTNKVWAWVDRAKTIWKQETYE